MKEIQFITFENSLEILYFKSPPNSFLFKLEKKNKSHLISIQNPKKMKLNYQSWNLLSERKREKGWNYSIRKIEGKQPREIINLRIEFRGRSLSDIYTSSCGFLRGRFVPSNYTCTVESPRTFARGGQDKRGVRGPINGRRHALDSLPPGSPLAWVPCANVYIRMDGVESRV